MTRSSKADARMMNFLAPPPDRDVCFIASRLQREDWTYRAQTGLLDFKSRKMVVSLKSCQSRVPEFIAEAPPGISLNWRTPCTPVRTPERQRIWESLAGSENPLIGRPWWVWLH